VLWSREEAIAVKAGKKERKRGVSTSIWREEAKEYYGCYGSKLQFVVTIAEISLILGDFCSLVLGLFNWSKREQWKKCCV